MYMVHVSTLPFVSSTGIHMVLSICNLFIHGYTTRHIQPGHIHTIPIVLYSEMNLRGHTERHSIISQTHTHVHIVCTHPSVMPTEYFVRKVSNNHRMCLMFQTDVHAQYLYVPTDQFQAAICMYVDTPRDTPLSRRHIHMYTACVHTYLSYQHNIL